ncbi:Zinc finger BED domain-containing protein 5-like [Oopsacas minuta]|uniref:Zinc finger BED domain-containing protein 5-like n=1 Tax=Oopsacas minuta TaxID=111878 RepID=A0AAV7KJA0_9METZ|nr:Zinc finger BED domain-containing protein 5-like [Oopsacas minuta]
MKQVVVTMLGQTESKKLMVLSLSNDTLRKRIVGMSEDVLEQILQQVNDSAYYATQPDESLDIASMSQLSVFIRYVSDCEIIENYAFCRVLPTTTTTGFDILKCLNTLFVSKNIGWGKCVGICIDGAAACTGIRNGVVKRIQDVAKSAKWTHCFIHREALMAMDLSPIE